jgi:hypothetical protein
MRACILSYIRTLSQPKHMHPCLWGLCTYVRMYMYACMYEIQRRANKFDSDTHTRTWAYAYMYLCMYVSMYAYYTYMDICIYVCMHAHIDTHMGTYIPDHVHNTGTYDVYMHACMHIVYVPDHGHNTCTYDVCMYARTHACMLYTYLITVTTHAAMTYGMSAPLTGMRIPKIKFRANVWMHSCICMYVCIMYVCMHLCMYGIEHLKAELRANVWMHSCIFLYVCMHIRVYVRIHVRRYI